MNFSELEILSQIGTAAFSHEALQLIHPSIVLNNMLMFAEVEHSGYNCIHLDSSETMKSALNW